MPYQPKQTKRDVPIEEASAYGTATTRGPQQTGWTVVMDGGDQARELGANPTISRKASQEGSMGAGVGHGTAAVEPGMTGRIDGWVNLQDYMGLNADKGREMSQTVAGDVGAKARAAQENLSKSKGAFDQSVTEGIQTVGGYSGPTEYSDKAAMDATREAGEDVAASQTSSGRGTLAREHYGQGSQGYTGTKASALDEALMGGQGGDSWDELKRQYGDVGGAYGEAAAAGAKDASAAQSLNDLNRGQVAASEKAAQDAAEERAGRTDPYDTGKGRQFSTYDEAVDKAVGAGSLGYIANPAGRPTREAVNAIREMNRLFGPGSDAGGMVYNSMTQDEIEALGAMSQGDAASWLRERLASLGLQ